VTQFKVGDPQLEDRGENKRKGAEKSQKKNPGHQKTPKKKNKVWGGPGMTLKKPLGVRPPLFGPFPRSPQMGC